MSGTWDGTICARTCVTYGMVSWPRDETQGWLECFVRFFFLMDQKLRLFMV